MNENQINEYRSLIEKDLEWRTEEIALFSNQIRNFKPSNTSEEKIKRTDLDKKRFRKLLVLILYAHFEGFFRYSFRIYVDAINDANIEIEKAVDRLTVTSLYKEFGEYDNLKELINVDSSDFSKVNKRLENRQKLFEKITKRQIGGKIKLHVTNNHNDKNSILYTESNLNYVVITKILYRLGFEPSEFEFDEINFKNTLNEFLEKRNSISHGDGKYKDGVEEKDYSNFKDLFDKAVKFISVVITNCLREKRYLKSEYRSDL